MDAMPDGIELALRGNWRMRLGRKLGRTLYLRNPWGESYEDDLCVGIVDSEALAREIMRRWNSAEQDQIPGMVADIERLGGPR